jgi:glycosyltransferase involved in cell wall biosynthesis
MTARRTDRSVASPRGRACLRLDANVGKGAAIRRGLPEVRSDVIVLIDGDGQDDPTEIRSCSKRCVRTSTSSSARASSAPSSPGAITPLNSFGNRFLTVVINQLFRDPAHRHAGRVQGVPY